MTDPTPSRPSAGGSTPDTPGAADDERTPTEVGATGDTGAGPTEADPTEPETTQMPASSSSDTVGTEDPTTGAAPSDDVATPHEPALAQEPPTGPEPQAQPDPVVAPAPVAEDRTDDPDDDDALDAEDQAYRREIRKGLLLGIGAGVVGGLIVSLVLGAFVWPGWFTGPGQPDDAANSAIAAFAARDPVALAAVTCQGPDGPTSTIPPDALAQITSAVPAGPLQTTIDTEARAPLNLTISGQGQAQTLPASVILGVNDGSWCLVGLSERQQ